MIHCTKKLLDRIKPATLTSEAVSSMLLGNWYATALFWTSQVALMVNEKTLLPALMPLAPATDLAARLPERLAEVLTVHDMPRQFIDDELAK